MNARRVLFSVLSLALGSIASAQNPASPPIAQGFPAPISPRLQPGEQRVYGPTSDTLIARHAADGIIEGFRKVYKSDGAPRVVIYVNRALIDTTTTTSGTNTYTVKDAKPLTLADQQTVREVERLFGRVFRHAGAQLADQQIATALLPTQAGDHLTGDQAARRREALAVVADIAIEVLISSRNLTVPQVSGDVTYPVPDIQATAIRLKDAAIVGQAAASDIIGKGVQAGQVIRQFDVSDITEATAIALMEDMLTGTK